MDVKRLARAAREATMGRAYIAKVDRPEPRAHFIGAGGRGRRAGRWDRAATYARVDRPRAPLAYRLSGILEARAAAASVAQIIL